MITLDYTVEINNFEGPLDLLLHLIKQSEMNICDINIDEITNQYLAYINKMEKMNLNVASEYLVMAAELMEIKSSTLLPKPSIETEDDYDEDPRDELINRLLEYERYKNITTSLKEFEQERGNVFSKEPYNLSEIIDSEEKIDETFNIEDLLKAFNDMLIRQELNKPLGKKITSKEYSVSERSKQILDVLKDKKRIDFIELFETKEKDYIVVTFLSILDLTRNGEITIIQDKNFDNILLQLKVGE